MILQGKISWQNENKKCIAKNHFTLGPMAHITLVVLNPDTMKALSTCTRKAPSSSPPMNGWMDGWCMDMTLFIGDLGFVG
jgi:hypothetical protein